MTGSFAANRDTPGRPIFSAKPLTADAAMQRVFFAAVFILLIATALPAATRKWTSKDGRFSTDAELVDADDVNVTLKKRSGETVTVPLELLSELDRRFLRAQKKKPAAPKENPTAPKVNAVDYAREVQPFLMRYCAECHNQNKAKDGYDVTSYAALTRPGKNGPLVVPGKLDGSRLMEVMRGMSKSMPPGKAPQPAPEEITKIGAWIDAGAKDDAATPLPAAGKGKVSGPRKPTRKPT